MAWKRSRVRVPVAPPKKIPKLALGIFFGLVDNELEPIHAYFAALRRIVLAAQLCYNVAIKTKRVPNG
jgi:hypothetical protein